MRLITSTTAVALVVGFSLTGMALAHDLIPPDWRGQDGTTYQEWRFDTNANPALPDVINNPYGGAIANITVGAAGSGWHYQLAAGFGPNQTGYWDLGGAGGSIVIDIDNRPEPLPYKEVSVQVTYWEDIHAAPSVNVPNAVRIGGQTVLVEDTGFGEWWLDQSIWRMEPNPASEQVIISAHPTYQSVVDQVVIDTICAPEPGMALLTIVAFGGILRRRGR